MGGAGQLSPFTLVLPRGKNVSPDPLRLRVDFHDECTVIHDHANGRVRSKVVSALDIAHALARELDLSTGILPPAALWWTNTAGGPRIAVWCEPRIWAVSLRETPGGAPRRLRLPFPGLVFLCLPARQAPYVFAARERPTSPDAQLFHTPAYNVFKSGRVCVGSHAFPADPARVPAAFFESHFSVTGDTAAGKSRRHPGDIGKLWHELDRKERYPLDDLVPQLTVADAMNLGE